MWREFLKIKRALLGERKAVLVLMRSRCYMRVISIDIESLETIIYHAPASKGGPEEIRLPFIKTEIDI